MKIDWSMNAADRRLLPEGRFAGPMPWMIAIMMFLTVLSAAGGIALKSASGSLGQSLADRITIQIIHADAAERDRQAKAAGMALDGMSGVVRHHLVPPAEMNALLEPWLGGTFAQQDLPVPALIDVDLAAGEPNTVARVDAAVRKVAPAARIDDHGDFLKPLDSLLSSLSLLALAVVMLMASATAFTVILTARSALDTHRPTIDVMHLLGATDVQIARLFQRRIALDAVFGGTLGLAAASLVIFGLGGQIARVGSALVGSVSLPGAAWVVLVALPIGGVVLAMSTARLTILRALGRSL